MTQNQKGLTLVEVLVSGLIGALVAGMVLTALGVEMDATNHGVAGGRLLGHARSVSAQLAASVRAGRLVLQPDEDVAPSDPSFPATFTSEIHIYDTTGMLSVAYRIGQTALKHSSDGETWQPFTVGGFAVNVASGSSFMLSADRKCVTLNIELTTTHRGKTYSLPLTGDSFRCRN